MVWWCNDDETFWHGAQMTFNHGLKRKSSLQFQPRLQHVSWKYQHVQEKVQAIYTLMSNFGVSFIRYSFWFLFLSHQYHRHAIGAKLFCTHFFAFLFWNPFKHFILSIKWERKKIYFHTEREYKLIWSVDTIFNLFHYQKSDGMNSTVKIDFAMAFLLWITKYSTQSHVQSSTKHG